jgi:hypothetical protein
MRRLVQRLRWLVVVLGLALVGTPGGRVEASPIRQYQLTARAGAAWSSYLAGGAQLWAQRAAPRITAGVRMAMAQALGSANPRLSPWVQYLLWRQSLNPARFDRWHPQMVPFLSNLPPVKNVCPCPCTTCTPSKPIKPQQHHGPGKTPSPGTILPPGPTVPEPNTLLISVALIGSGFLWRYHTGRSHRDDADPPRA